MAEIQPSVSLSHFSLEKKELQSIYFFQRYIPNQINLCNTPHFKSLIKALGITLENSNKLVIQNFQALMWLKKFIFTTLFFSRTMFSIVNILETFAQDLLCWKSEILATGNILIWVLFFCEASYKPQYFEHSHTFIHSFNKYLPSAMHWPSLWGISRK